MYLHVVDVRHRVGAGSVTGRCETGVGGEEALAISGHVNTQPSFKRNLGRYGVS